MKLFTNVLFPPGLGLLTLLLLPFPPSVGQMVVKVCDTFLFVHPHPQIPMSLFWVIFLNCVSVLYVNYQDMVIARLGYAAEKARGHHYKERDRWLVKVLAKQRNFWASFCVLMMWVMLHRYRSLLKKSLTTNRGMTGNTTEEKKSVKQA